MSQDKQLDQQAIEDLIASMNTAQPPAPSTPPPSEDPNKKLDQQAIEDLIASMNASQPPAPPTPPTSEDPNKQLDQQAIEDLIASMNAPQPPAPPTPPPSEDPNKKLDQQAIEDLIASMNAPQPPAPLTPPPSEDPNKKLDQQAIEDLIASMNAPQPPAPPTPPPSEDSNKQLDQQAIEDLIASMNAPQPPTPPPSEDPNKKLDQQAIEDLIASMNASQPPAPSTPPPSEDPNKQLDQQATEDLIASMNASQPPEPPTPPPSEDPNKQLDQQAIEDLITSMNASQPPEPPTPPPSEDPNKQLDQQATEDLIASMNASQPPELPTPPPSEDPNKQLDQQAIEDLIASLNTNQSSPPTEKTLANQPQQVSESTILSTATAEPSQQILDAMLSETQPEQQQIEKTTPFLLAETKTLFNKKIAALIIICVLLAIAGGSYLGYVNSAVSRQPKPALEQLTEYGITFENKNLVAYAGHGDKDIVPLFLQAGMSANVTRSTDNWTPLIAASTYNRTAIVQMLLDAGADVNARDLRGKTALMQAAATGAEDVIIQLLKNGADPNIEDSNGRTALKEALVKQHAKIAQLLVAAGARPVTEINQKTTATQTSQTISAVPLPTTPTAAAVPKEFLLSAGKAGAVQIGMLATEVPQKYSSFKIGDTYVNDTSKLAGYVYINSNTNPAMVLNIYNGKVQLVSTIQIYDEQFKTEKQIGVNSTLGDIRKQYTISEMTIKDNSLFASVKATKMLFELNITRNTIPTEWFNTGNPNALPNDLKVRSVVLY